MSVFHTACKVIINLSMETMKTVRLLPSRFVSAETRVYEKSFHKIWHKVGWIRWCARCCLFGEVGAPCFALAASSHWCSKLLKVGRFAVGQVNDTQTPFRSIPLSDYPPVLHPKSESSLHALNPLPAGLLRGVRGCLSDLILFADPCREQVCTRAFFRRRRRQKVI